MTPDYYHDFRQLPVSDLVKIYRTPSDYLPEAVTAAGKILQERGITQEQIAEEEWAIAQQEMSDGIRKHERRDFTAWIENLFGTDLNSDPSVKWLIAFIILYALFYAYNIFIIFRQIAWVIRCIDCPPYAHSLMTFDLIFACYTTISFYFILKQKWIGWTLLLIHVFFIISMNLGILLRFYLHRELFVQRIWYHTFPMLIYIAFGVFLYRPSIRSTYKINENILAKSMAAAGAVGILEIVITLMQPN